MKNLEKGIEQLHLLLDGFAAWLWVSNKADIKKEDIKEYLSHIRHLNK